MTKIAIILTGTISPSVKGGCFTSTQRFEMYTQTLDYYAQTIGKSYPIIFLENSGANLSEWDNRYRKYLDLTVIQFTPDTKEFEGFDNSKGKGYNEYLMIKKGILKMANTPPHQQLTHVLKITGRYPMLNILSILAEAERRLRKNELVFIGDIKDTCIYKLVGRDTLSSHWGDSRFFIAEINFYKDSMIDCYIEMNDYEPDKWAEHYFLRLSRKFRNDPRFQFRFTTQVRFDGVSGAGSNASYNSTSSRIKAYARQLGRFLFPNIWF